jgi:ATP-dependent Lon protease
MKKYDLNQLPPELKELAHEMLARLERMEKLEIYSTEYERTTHYLEWITNLPWNRRSEDLLDLTRAKTILDKNHYGLEGIKDRILEYLAVLKLQSFKVSDLPAACLPARQGKAEFQSFKVKAPILAFFGLVGTGKTTIAYSIAEAIGRKFVRVPLGGMGDPLDLRGQSRQRPEAEPGLIAKALRRAGTKNPVILLDEIDRVTEEGRSSIMGVLVELLDPEQNMAFRDHFIDYPLDLSEVLFVATANNSTNIATAVLDRLEPMQMPSYTDEEKIVIGRDFVLPETLIETGLSKENLIIAEEVWPKIVRPLGFDAGIRTLERTINGICRKAARLVVEGKGKKFVLTVDNIKDFLPQW